MNKRPKITIISSYYEPDVTACTYYYVNLAHDFAELGADVTVVCGIPNRLVTKEQTAYYIANPIEKINEHLQILRVGPKNSEGKNFIYRAIYHLFRSFAVYRKAKNIPSDAYLICSAPPFMGLAGALLAKKTPTIYNLQDLFPDSLVQAKGLSEKNMLVRIFRKVEQYIYQNNTHLLTISQDMADNLQQRNVAKEKISVVYNWVDEQEVEQIPRINNLLFERFNLSREKFYLCYAGNIGLLQNLRTIVEAAAELQNTPEIEFVIIGDGAYKDTMLAEIAAKKLTNIHVFPMQPVADAAHIYSLGDVGLVSLSKGASKSAMPSKTWSIMSASCPVLCEADTNSELAKIITENQAGIAVASGDVQDMVVAIKYLFNHQTLRQEMGKNGRAFIEANLTRKQATKKYFQLVEKQIEGSKGADHV